MVIVGASGSIPRTATKRPCYGSTEQQGAQPVESVSQSRLRTTKTGKPGQRLPWSEEKCTFIMHQYYIITKLETIKIGYRQEERLTSADLFTETGAILTAIQDQDILTRNYKKYILKQPNMDELCRRFRKESETIQHITVACEQLAPTEYVRRYDGLAKVIHQKLAEAADLIEDKSPYYT